MLVATLDEESARNARAEAALPPSIQTPAVRAPLTPPPVAAAASRGSSPRLGPADLASMVQIRYYYFNAALGLSGEATLSTDDPSATSDVPEAHELFRRGVLRRKVCMHYDHVVVVNRGHAEACFFKKMENSKASEQGWRVEDTEVVIDPDSVALARAARTGGSTRSEATLDGRFAIDVELGHLRTGYSARATVQTNDPDAISADPAKREAWRLRVLHQKVSQLPQPQ